MSKPLAQRISDSFPDGQSAETKEFRERVYETWKDTSSSLSRTALLVFLLMAIFELLAYQATPATISFGSFTIANSAIVQVALPTVVAFVLYEGYRLSVRWLNLRRIYSELTRIYAPLQADNYLDILIGPNLPALWGIGQGPVETTLAERFISTVNTIVMLTMMLIVPVGFECQAYYRLIQKFGSGDAFLWVGLAVTIFLYACIALYILLGMSGIENFKWRQKGIRIRGLCESTPGIAVVLITRMFHTPGSVANEFQCQPGHGKGREKDRQEPLSGAPERDGLVLGGVEGLSAAGVPSIADLQGMVSRLDWYLDRVVHLDRTGPLTVDHDIVRPAPDLRSDRLMRHLQRRRHLLLSSRSWAAAMASPLPALPPRPRGPGRCPAPPSRPRSCPATAPPR